MSLPRFIATVVQRFDDLIGERSMQPRTFVRSSLAAAIGFAILCGAASPCAAAESAYDGAPAAASESYLVRFVDAGVLHYTGGITGLAATAAATERPGKVDFAEAPAVAYRRYLQQRAHAHIDAIEAALGRTIALTHRYDVGFSGISTPLTEEEAARVASLPGIESVKKVRVFPLSTYRGPTFIGADRIWNGEATPPTAGASRGEGEVIAMLDTGYTPGHPAFADDASCGFGASRHKVLSAVDCIVSNGSSCTGTHPEDFIGHGTHTASTAAGNALTSATDPAPPLPAGFDRLSGVAPCAQLRIYRVCAAGGCSQDAIIAGIHGAIEDGVDVLSFSISSDFDPWDPADSDRNFLDATQADIAVVTAAGNTSADVPRPEGQANHLAPWLLSIAASTHDEIVARPARVSASGPGTPPSSTQNIGLVHAPATPEGPVLTGQPIRDYAANREGCTAGGAFPANYFAGAIALMKRGDCTYDEKINNAQAAGAILALVYDVPAESTMFTDTATLPAYSFDDGDALVGFIDGNGTTPTTADFSPAGTQGDVLAGFSFRGPNERFDVTKPDLTGPGVEILAGGLPSQHSYIAFSGTSMSTPHVAGSVALVRSLHRDWTPTEALSALMLAANPIGTREDALTPWSPDDVGSGRVDLTRAALAGLVMDEEYDRFLAANPATGGDPRSLNLASMRHSACAGQCAWMRTLRNTLPRATTWEASVQSPAGLTVTVSPTTFDFSGAGVDPAGTVFRGGFDAVSQPETQTLTVAATPTTTLSQPTFARIVLTEAEGLSPPLTMTVAVQTP